MIEGVQGHRAPHGGKKPGRPSPRGPAVGMEVGGFLLEAMLGRGSFGTVYRARRGGKLYAIKFLYLPWTEPWAWRELEVLLRLRRVGWVAVEGYGVWPDQAPCFLFLALPFVRGQLLFDWARHTNPTARQVVEVMRSLNTRLGEVHQAGVVHRDVKATNVLMREEDGQPVLVDFGVGTYPDAPEITPAGMPPGTALYRSPEVTRARREQGREERYRSTPGDDLWSLGVLFYWLLTGAYPFEGRDEASLASAITDAAPRATHARNPRVPQTVSEVCLRMLEKAPEARYPDARAVGEALEAALARADAAWEVPLGEAWGPDNATTPVLEELGLAEAMARFQRLGEYERQLLRRGVPESPREADLEPPGMREDARSEPEPVEPPRARDTRPVTRGTWVLGMMALLLLLALWVWTSGSAVPRMPGDSSPPGQEVAPPGGPLEGGEGATPSWHSTSAPVASATPPKDTRLKTPRHTSASPEKSSSSPPGSVAAKAGTAMLLCALGTHCSAPSAQVRTQPPPEPCPAGALESMAALGIEEGDKAGSTFEGVRGESVFTIREGPGARLVLGRPLGKLLPGTVLLGHFVFNKERASGRFTEAQTPEGTNWHVCLEAWDWGDDYGRGLVREPGSPPGTAKVFASPHVRAVKQFK